MGLTTEQQIQTMGLVDEILVCSSRLAEGNLDEQQREELRSSMRARVAQIKTYFNSADGS